jgi:hypothetical protein
MKTAKNNVHKGPFEIFEAVQACSNQADRIKILLENESYELKTILQGSFRSDIVFDLPEGAPPYKKNTSPPGLSYSPLKKQIDIVRLLLVGNNSWNKLKKETSFIKFIEQLNEKDAEIIIAMKDKKLTKKYSTITASLVKKAFPSLGIE